MYDQRGGRRGGRAARRCGLLHEPDPPNWGCVHSCRIRSRPNLNLHRRPRRRPPTQPPLGPPSPSLCTTRAHQRTRGKRERSLENIFRSCSYSCRQREAAIWLLDHSARRLVNTHHQSSPHTIHTDTQKSKFIHRGLSSKISIQVDPTHPSTASAYQTPPPLFSTGIARLSPLLPGDIEGLKSTSRNSAHSYPSC